MCRGRPSHAETAPTARATGGNGSHEHPLGGYHPGMAGDRPVLLGLLLYLLVAATPTVLFWAALRLLPAAVTAWTERRRRRHAPAGPALESVVANLRRLRREVCCGAYRTQVRRVALQAAYDDTLLECCRLVEVDAPLAAADDRERAFARLLTEAELEAAGIALDPPRGGTAAA
jgi:hypothetical protein